MNSTQECQFTSNNLYYIYCTYTHTYIHTLSLLTTTKYLVTWPSRDSGNCHSVAPGQHLCTVSPPLLLDHFLHLRHCTAPFCFSTSLSLSTLHLCLFRSQLLPHTLHPTAWVALCDWLSSSGEHLSTASLPLLLNQRPHASH